ncbi:MAG: hypothetical protein IPH48_13830 [bacterium]|nr:hypothetical protein [bacterium]
MQTVASSWLGSTPLGDHGPFSLASTGVIALHEVWLPAGPVTVKLHQSGGDAIDWGLTLHRGQLPYHAKSATAGIVGQAWIGAAGADETMPVTVPQAGYYCLAVWKARAGDYAKAGQYTLRFDGFLWTPPGVGDVPAVTAVRDITPNPFNPATRIAFDLAHSGPVRLEVFDVRGRLVRRLVSSALEAGRHEVLWDGRDDQGVGAASGTPRGAAAGGGGHGLAQDAAVEVGAAFEVATSNPSNPSGDGRATRRSGTTRAGAIRIRTADAGRSFGQYPTAAPRRLENSPQRGQLGSTPQSHKLLSIGTL